MTDFRTHHELPDEGGNGTPNDLCWLVVSLFAWVGLAAALLIVGLVLWLV